MSTLCKQRGIQEKNMLYLCVNWQLPRWGYYAVILELTVNWRCFWINTSGTHATLNIYILREVLPQNVSHLHLSSLEPSEVFANRVLENKQNDPRKELWSLWWKPGLEPVPEMSNTTTFAHSSCAASMVYRSKGMHCQEFTFCGGYLMPVFLQLLETLVHRIYILTRAKGKAQQKSGRPVRE